MTRIPHALLGLLGLFCVPAAAVAQLGTLPLQSASVTATGTTRSRLLADHLGDMIRATNFGACVWDGAHDVAPCIQAAISAAAAAGGGDVIVPVGSNELASTLVIGTDLVRLFGFRDAVTAGVLLDAVPLGEVNDVQDNIFSIRGTNGDTDGDGIRFQATGNSGAWNGNVSLNIFDYARIRVRNGWCFNYTSASPNQSADNDYFWLASCQQVGNTAGSGGLHCRPDRRGCQLRLCLHRDECVEACGAGELVT